jgi:hypothetical protein
MATNLKKTSVSGRVPNTFTLSTDGDIGINTHDGKMYISNSSNVFEVGANISGNTFIGGSITSVDSITLDVNNPVTAGAPGTLSWNIEEDCLNIFQSDDSILQTGLEQYIRVKNSTGSTITNGTLVMFTGVNGNNEPTAAALVANSSFNPLYSIGVLTNDIENNTIGRATTFGKVRNLDTTGSTVSETWAEGDLLWANPNYNGKLTKVKPTAPTPAISVAAVLKAHATDGILLIRPLLQPRLYYGVFTSNTTQTCLTSNTATPITYNTVQFASGHEIVTYDTVANSALQANFSGLYNYQFSLQVQSSSASKHSVWIWARKNGVDIPASATEITIESNGGNIVPAWNFVVSMAAGDKFQLMWATDAHTAVSIISFANTAFCPSIPSVIMTVSEIAQ